MILGVRRSRHFGIMCAKKIKTGKIRPNLNVSLGRVVGKNFG